MNRKNDRAVEEALYRRACGYDVTETVVEESEHGQKRKTTTYHVPGDLRAMIFYLRNRMPKVWKDKPDMAALHAGSGVQIVDDIP